MSLVTLSQSLRNNGAEREELAKGSRGVSVTRLSCSKKVSEPDGGHHKGAAPSAWHTFKNKLSLLALRAVAVGIKGNTEIFDRF